MSTDSQNGGNKTPLNDDLDNIHRVYGQLEQDEPPELLDQAILNRAHRAVESKPHWMQFGWLHGLTTTAVFVLAFFIIMNQREPVPDDEDGVYSVPTAELQSRTPARKAAEPLVKERRAQTRQETVAADEATEPAGFMQQEIALEEAAPVTDAAQAGNAALQPAAAMGVAETAKRDLKSLAIPDPEQESDPERELLEILRLKQAGDESWQEALQLFLERYPDYTLPAELKN